MAAVLSKIAIPVGFVKQSLSNQGVGVGVGGLAVVEAENENTPLAGGFWVLNLHEPGVGSKPILVIVPVPVTVRNPLPCWVMEDDVRL